MKVRINVILRRLCAPIAALGILAVTALADQPDTALHPPTNAALLYWPAFAATEMLTENQIKIIRNWRDVPLDDKSIWLVTADNRPYRTSFQHLHAGSLAPGCDWGLDFSQGPYLLLPYLNYGKDLSQRGCLSVRYELHQNHGHAAVEATRDVLVLARNMAHDPIIVAELLRYGIEKDAIEAISMGLDKLDAKSLAELASMINTLPPTATETDSIRLEAQVIPGWAIGKVTSAGEHPDFQAIFGFMKASEAKGTGDESVEDAVKSAGGSPTGVLASLRKLLTYYDEAEKLVAARLTQDEFRPKAEELRHRFDGVPFAKAILPALPRAHDATVAADTRLTLLNVAIAAVQNGPEAVKAFTDRVNHQPIAYEKLATGFRLTSKVMERGEAVTLTIGGAK
jgi:hypothetical protein